jgi:hypothetical protein
LWKPELILHPVHPIVVIFFQVLLVEWGMLPDRTVGRVDVCFVFGEADIAEYENDAI